MHKQSIKSVSPYRQQVRRILGLVLPMAWSRFIQMVGWFIGMLMIARLGKSELAASALINSTMVAILVIFMTLLFAVSVVTGRLYGQSKPKEVGALFQQGLLFSVSVGLIVTLIFFHLSHFLLWTGQSSALVIICKRFFDAFAFASVPFMLTVCMQQVCYGILKQRLVIIVNIICTLALIPVAYLLIYGGLGIRAMGVAGLGYAFLIQNVLNVTLLVVSFYWIADFKKYHLFSRHKHRGMQYIKQLYTVGWPMSVQFGGELVGFFVLTIFTGWLGTAQLAASQITQQIILLFLVPLFAVSEAAGILVSQSIGAKQFSQITREGNICVALGMIGVALFSILFFAMPTTLTHLYINVNDPANAHTVLLARWLFYVSSVMLMMDAMRNLYTGALRGFYDTQYPMWVGLIGLWIIAIPLAYLFGFTLHWGVVGIRIACIVGFTFGSIILVRRWVTKSKQVITAGHT